MSKFESGLENIPTYQEFGKFIIQKKKLLYDNTLLLKYKNSRGPVPNLKRQKIEEPLKILLLNILDTGTINYELVKDCSDDDRKLFEQILRRADLVTVLDYKKAKGLTSDNEVVEKWEILKGELLAGNTNQEIRNELKDVTKILIEKGKINKELGKDLISELNITE
jgi:hypothetical protein